MGQFERPDSTTGVDQAVPPPPPPPPPGPGYWQSPDGRWWPADQPPYVPPSPPSPGWWQSPDGAWHGPDQPPYTPPPPEPVAGTRTPRRRVWVWVVVGVGVLVLSVLVLVGVNSVFNGLDVYHQDLTKDRGDFRAIDRSDFSTRYAADGYHLVIHQPHVWVPDALEAPTDHAALTVEVVATQRRSPTGAEFGPTCWQGADHGYGLMYQADGHLGLAQFTNGRALTLASTTTAAWRTGATVHLLLSCTLPGVGRGDPALVGYLNGKKMLSATATDAVSAFRHTGFLGHTADAAPAEWVVSSFWRRGPGGGVPSP